MKKLFRSLFAFSLLVPFFVSAQAGTIDLTYLNGYKSNIIGIINNILVPVLIAIAFVTFLWGVYKYFILPDGEREEGRQFIMYGIIGFVIIVSVWGLVNMVRVTLVPSTSGIPSYPTLPTQ